MTQARYDRVNAILLAAAARARELYESERIVDGIRQETSRAIERAAARLPTGLGIFTPEALYADGTSYVEVRFFGRHGTEDRYVLEISRIDVRDGRAHRDGVDFAECSAEAFHRDRRDFLSSLTARQERPWTTASMAGTNFYALGSWVLPLGGPVLDQHRAVRFAATTAAAILEDRDASEAFATYRRHAALANLGPRVERMAHEAARAVALEGVDVEALKLTHAALVSELVGHDHHHAMADRFIRSAADREDRIARGLYKLSLDDAIAVYVACGAPMGRLQHMLMTYRGTRLAA